MARTQIIIPLVIWNIEELNVTERLVCSVVYGYTKQGKPCFMTNKGLGKLLRVSNRTISAAVNKLIDGEYIEALDLDHRRQLAWKKPAKGVEESSRGGGSQLLGGVEVSSRGGGSQLLPVIENINRDLNKDHIMNGEIKENEKKPATWQEVRDYLATINAKDGQQNTAHLVAWAQDFMTYYSARNWTTKHGAIDKWRPVALAWYKRSAERVPQRAVKRVDYDALRRDLKWHQRRLDNYIAEERRDLAYKEVRAIQAIKHHLNNEPKA
jgi:hypothetical protein